MKREFIYRGYKISQFEYDYSTKKDWKWCANNIDNCDEEEHVSKTFENMLDMIDEIADEKLNIIIDKLNR